MKGPDLTLNGYQESAGATAFYRDNLDDLVDRLASGRCTAEEISDFREMLRISYALIALAGEVGELSNLFKKELRTGKPGLSDTYILESPLEIGDVLWYTALLSSEHRHNLDEVAKKNIAKLRERLQ